MAENLFQSIRGAQFRGSRYPGFKTVGQQQPGDALPGSEAPAPEPAPQPASTALARQTFSSGGPQGSDTTGPDTESDAGKNRSASAVGLTRGDALSYAGRAVGATVGGIPGAVIGAFAKGGGAYVDAKDYDATLADRGISKSIDKGRAIGNALAGPFGSKDGTAVGQFETALEQQREADRGRGMSPDGYTGPNTGFDTPSERGPGPGVGAAPSETATPDRNRDSPSESAGGPGAGASSDGSGGGGYGGGTSGDSGEGGRGGFSKGGIVTADRLRGPNPPGPDDGMANLKIGEAVLTPEATRRLGPDVIRALNKGWVSRETVLKLIGR